MAGASGATQRVRYVNANWQAGEAGDDGSFALLVVTEDGLRHELEPSPAAMAALVALTRAGSVFLFDPENRTLIAANLVGEWIPQSWSSADRRAEG